MLAVCVHSLEGLLNPAPLFSSLPKAYDHEALISVGGVGVRHWGSRPSEVGTCRRDHQAMVALPPVIAMTKYGSATNPIT
jgi:hypothetical protein